MDEARQESRAGVSPLRWDSQSGGFRRAWCRLWDGRRVRCRCRLWCALWFRGRFRPGVCARSSPDPSLPSVVLFMLTLFCQWWCCSGCSCGDLAPLGGAGGQKGFRKQPDAVRAHAVLSHSPGRDAKISAPDASTFFRITRALASPNRNPRPPTQISAIRILVANRAQRKVSMNKSLPRSVHAAAVSVRPAPRCPSSAARSCWDTPEARFLSLPRTRWP